MNVLRHLPNLITMLRFVLIVPVVLSLLGGNFRWGLAFFAIAGLSDGLTVCLRATSGGPVASAP